MTRDGGGPVPPSRDRAVLSVGRLSVGRLSVGRPFCERHPVDRKPAGGPSVGRRSVDQLVAVQVSAGAALAPE